MRHPVLVTMSGPAEIDVASLSNFEAGIAYLSLLGKLNPGMTFGDLARALDNDAYRLSGWWTSLKKAVGDVKDGIGDVMSDAVNLVGGKAGDATRLVTDEKVMDGIARAGTAYATGGGSEGVRAVLDPSGQNGGAIDSFLSFVSGLGESFKTRSAAAVSRAPNWLPWAAAAGGGLLLALVLRPRGGR